jgi:hypothetical protein
MVVSRRNASASADARASASARKRLTATVTPPYVPAIVVRYQNKEHERGRKKRERETSTAEYNRSGAPSDFRTEFNLSGWQFEMCKLIYSTASEKNDREREERERVYRRRVHTDRQRHHPPLHRQTRYTVTHCRKKIKRENELETSEIAQPKTENLSRTGWQPHAHSEEEVRCHTATACATSESADRKATDRPVAHRVYRHQTSQS